MKNKHSNPNLIKMHRSYTVEEAALACKVHKNTVRRWIKDGLRRCDNQRPTLILGRDLREFLKRKRAKHKTKLKPGEIYCVRCREARNPAENYAELEASNTKIGNLLGICPTCDSVIYRRVSLMRISDALGKLQVSIPEALEPLIKGANPSLNSDFN